MKDLLEIIGTLKKSEIIKINKYYKSDIKFSLNKKYKLFQGIVDGQILTNIDASQIVYGETRSSVKLTRLIERLIKDILYIISLENGKSTFNSEYFRARHEVQQLLIDAEIMFGRGLSDIGFKLLKKIYNKSIKYELTNEQLIIIDLMQKQIGQIRGSKKYKEYSLKKNFVLKQIELKNKAFETYYDIMLPHVFSGKDIQYKEGGYELVKKLELLYNESESREVYSLMLRSKVFYYSHIKDHKEALNAGKQFLTLVKTDSILKSKSNLGGAYMQLSLISLYNLEYDESLNFIKKALSNFNTGTSNELRAKNIEFVLYSITGKLELMTEILIKVKNKDVLKHDKYMRDMWFLREATYLFLKGKYQESLTYIQGCAELIEDKSGWRIGLKLLELMCIVELRLFNWFDFRLDSLYRLLLSTKTKDTGRLKVILVLLKNLQKKNFEWLPFVKESRDKLLYLKEKEEWDPLSMEVIPFHNWCSTLDRAKP